MPPKRRAIGQSTPQAGKNLHYELQKQVSNGKQDWKRIDYAMLKPVHLKQTSNGKQDWKRIDYAMLSLEEDCTLI